MSKPAQIKFARFVPKDARPAIEGWYGILRWDDRDTKKNTEQDPLPERRRRFDFVHRLANDDRMRPVYVVLAKALEDRQWRAYIDAAVDALQDYSTQRVDLSCVRKLRAQVIEQAEVLGGPSLSWPHCS